MASEGGDSKNLSTVEDQDNGFNQAGTVKPSKDRFVFLCCKSPESWPSRVEDFEANLPMLLLKAIETREADMKVKTHFNICERIDEGILSDGDVLIFPDMIICRDTKESDVDSFVEDVLLNTSPRPVSSKDVLRGSYVFVCSHKILDKRGVSGPNLIQKFKEEIESKGLKDDVLVTACFPIGEQECAYDMIIFNINTEGKIDSYCCGNVSPCNLEEVLDCIRGPMGASVEKDKGIQNQKLEDGKELNKHEENSQGSGSTEIQETIPGCSPAMGQIGAPVQEDKGIQNQKLERGKELNKHEENSQGSGITEIQETISSCLPAVGQIGAPVEEDEGIQNQKLEDGKELNDEENSQGSGSTEIEETISCCSPTNGQIIVYKGTPKPSQRSGNEGGNRLRNSSILVGAIVAVVAAVAAVIYGSNRRTNRKRA